MTSLVAERITGRPAEAGQGAERGEAMDTEIEIKTDPGQAESNRARVRRIVYDPLGFRFPRAVDADLGARRLDTLADQLSYLTDDSLGALREMLRHQGLGSARCHWPERATVIALAEIVQPRPIWDIPELRRWFASVEGPQALLRRELVETWEYFSQRKRPPVDAGARAKVREAAEAARRRLAIIGEREAAGLSVRPDDLQWRVWYLDIETRLTAMVEGNRPC